MPMYVIDASFMLDYLLPDEHSDEVQNLFNRYKQGEVELCSSALFRLEVTNGLLMAARKKRISMETAHALLNHISRLKILFDDPPLLSTFSLAEDHHLTVYDASYLALAKEKGLPLLTLDEDLKSL